MIDSGGLYGAEKMLINLVAEQLKQGLEPTILSIGGAASGLKELETVCLDKSLPFKTVSFRKGFDFFAALRVIKWARENNFSLLHSHGYKPNILFGLIPIYFRKLPLIVTVHGHVKARFPTKIWFYEALDSIVLHFVQHVVFVANGMGDRPKSTLKASTINNGIPEQNINCFSGLPIEVEQFLDGHCYLVMAAGRLSAEKGFDVLIEAFSGLRTKNKNVGLLIAGEGPERANLENIVKTHGLQDHIALPGYVSDIQSLMKKATVWTIPSYTEGLPIVLLEALKEKCPVVATSVGGIPEALDYGRAGFIVLPGDPDKLGSELMSAISDRITRKDKAQWGYEQFLKYYSSEKMAKQYYELYKDKISSII